VYLAKIGRRNLVSGNTCPNLKTVNKFSYISCVYCKLYQTQCRKFRNSGIPPSNHNSLKSTSCSYLCRRMLFIAVLHTGNSPLLTFKRMTNITLHHFVITNKLRD